MFKLLKNALAWIGSQSELNFDVSGESGLEKERARLHLWQMFFANPYEWYDHRNKKNKPNQPDFKHKDTGEALWIHPRDPQWVKVQLQQLDSKLAGQNRREDSTSNFSSFV